MYTIQKAADLLGITYDGALKLMHKTGTGERHGRLVVLSEADLATMANVCEKYQTAKMGKGYAKHRKHVKAG